MDNIRLGNTFEVSWEINQFNGTETVPYDLSGKNLTLILSNALCKTKVDKFSVIGNIISFTFEGKDQKHVGKYSLILIENDGIEGMHVVDVCDAFRLVNRSCETCDDSSSIIDCTHIDFSSTMLSRRGISAYEYAKLNGYEGTEEEYAADCRAIPDLKDEVDSVLDGLGLEDIKRSIAEIGAAVEGKQNTIFDLETIRSGASKGASAIQGVIPNNNNYIAASREGAEIVIFPKTKPITEAGDPTDFKSGIADAYDVKLELEKRDAELAELSAEIKEELNNKIPKNADDYYPKIAVGTADNLSGVDEVASEFNFRRSGGGAITDGVARVQRIKGNSVVWNNMANTKAYENTFTYYDDSLRLVQGHRYFMAREVKGNALWCIPIVGGNQVYKYVATEEQTAIVFTSEYTTDSANTLLYSPGAVGGSCLVDLTKMFGSGNEPNTIDDFYQRMPMGIDLYAYNEGEVISMAASGIKSVGRNQWDEQWKVGRYETDSGVYAPYEDYLCSAHLTRCFGGQQYYVRAPKTILILWYDSDKRYIHTQHSGDKVVTAPSNAAFFNWRSNSKGDIITYNHDICINLYDTEFNGQYAPYMEAREDLSIVAKYFPQGMKSAGSAHDEIRYNKATNKWEKVVRIGEVDLGTIGYSRGKFGDIYAFSCQIPQANKMVGLANMTCGIYVARVVGAAALNNMEMRGDDRVAYPNSLYIRNDAYTDTASFRSAMSGVMLYYELAEPIVTEIEDNDFNLDYKVENGGTEEAIAEGKSSALSADITYGFNAVGLIKQIKAALQAAGIMV